MLAMRYRLVLMVLLSLSLAACQAIEGIFKAGVWVGVIMVVAVIALVGFAVAKMF
jgi:hypothetical protein